MCDSHYYYISTGAKNGFYTLRHVFKNHNSFKDNYIRNLSIDWDKALEKVVKITEKNGYEIHGANDPFPLTEFGRNSAVWGFVLANTNPYIIPFGKYVGKDFRIVNDNDYLVWLLDALSSKDVTRTDNYESCVIRVALALYLCDHLEGIEKAKMKEEEEKLLELERAEPVPNGKITITGLVLGTKTVDGYYGSVLKMLVKDNKGFKVWGTVPQNIKNLPDNTSVKGQTIKFNANVIPSNDDNKFGFFKRPTKCEVTA